MRRRRAEALREEYPAGLERGTGDPRTASRASRFLGTRRPSVGNPAANREQGPLRAVVVPPLGCLTSVDRLEFLQAAAGTHSHAGERALGEVDGHLGLVAQPLVEPGQGRAAAGGANAAGDYVRGL